MIESLIIHVHEVQGFCPIFRGGEQFCISDGYILKTPQSGICMHALASLMPYYVALSRGVSAAEVGLARPNAPRTAYVQCLDPSSLTKGGTVIFRIEVGNHCNDVLP